LAFSKVRAKPSARLDKSRHLLLVDRSEAVVQPFNLDPTVDSVVTESGE